MKREKITSLILTTMLCANNSLSVLAIENEFQEVVDSTATVENDLSSETNNEDSVDNLESNENVDSVENNGGIVDEVDSESESNVEDKNENDLIDAVEESSDVNSSFEQVIDNEISGEIGIINEDLKSEYNVTNSSPVVDKVLQITLDDGDFVPAMDNNPDRYTHVEVTTIGSKTLTSTDFNNLKNSKIPNIDLSGATAEVIPATAFYNAKHITSFKFPQGLKVIEGGSQSGAFYGCTGLRGDLVIPDTVTTIGHNAFYNAGYDGELVLGSSLETIGQSAFERCEFRGNLRLPSGLKSIGMKAFYSVKGFTGDLIIPDTVTSIGKESFRYCRGFDGELVLSNSLTSIPDAAFYNCSGFTGDLTIPDSVISIGDSAFLDCRFSGELRLSNNLQTIGLSAFSGCSGLTGDLNLPASLTVINNRAFYNCIGLTGDLVIPDAVTKLGEYAFYGCSGFNGTITLSNSLQTIGREAFYGCTGLVGDLIIPSVTSIGSYAFGQTISLTGNLVLPNSLTTLDRDAFSGACLTGDLNIPSSIQRIGENAFYGCTGFTGDLIIPDTVVEIGDYAFYGCSGFDGKLVISNSLTNIPINAFSNCSNLSGTLNIPSSVTDIASGAFSGCSRFEKLVMSNSVTDIGGSAFQGCTGLNSVELSNELVSIGPSSFRNCSGLTNLSIPKKVTTIGNEAFKGCSNLTGDIILPRTLATLNSGVFDNCDNLNSIILCIDETDASSNFKKSVIDNLNKDKAVLEMSYNLDISDTFINQLPDKMIGKPKLISQHITPTNSFSSEVGVLIPTNYDENDIVIYKDGQVYPLPSRSVEGFYVFNELGSYEVEIMTTLGTRSNIKFEIVPLIEKPIINDLNGNISIQAGNHNIYQNSILREDFSDANTKLIFSNQDWIIDSNGYMTSNDIGDDERTSNEVLINAVNGDKVKVSVRVSSQEYRDCGKIYINGIEVYSSSGANSDFDIIELNLKEGQNILKFEYVKDYSTSKYDDKMYIEYIEIQNKELVKSETIEYRINSGKWIKYNGDFKVPVEEIINGYVNIQTRTVINGLISDITEANVKIDLPKIIANDKELYVNDNFEELAGVKALDIDGTDISGNIKVSFSNVNPSLPGKYKVVYRIEGKNGYAIEKEVSVTVVGKIEVPENPGVSVKPEKPSIPVKPNMPIKPEVPFIQNQPSAPSVEVESNESVDLIVIEGEEFRKEVISIIDKLESDIVFVKDGEFSAEAIIEGLLTKEEINLIESFEVVENNINTTETGVYTVGYKFKTVYGEEFVRYVKVNVKSSEDILDNELVFGLNEDINDNMESVNENINTDKNIYVLGLVVSLFAIFGVVLTLLKTRKNK